MFACLGFDRRSDLTFFNEARTSFVASANPSGASGMMSLSVS